MLFLGLFLFLSCGTRNTKKTDIKEEIKTEKKTSNKTDIVNESDKKTYTKTESDISETRENLTPIDPSKPMKKTVEEKDGKKTITYENASVNSETKTDKSVKSQVSNEKTKTDSKSETEIKASQESEKSDQSKVTESDKGIGFSCALIWLLIIAIIFAVWYKYRNKVT